MITKTHVTVAELIAELQELPGDNIVELATCCASPQIHTGPASALKAVDYGTGIPEIELDVADPEVTHVWDIH